MYLLIYRCGVYPSTFSRFPFRREAKVPLFIVTGSGLPSAYASISLSTSKIAYSTFVSRSFPLPSYMKYPSFIIDHLWYQPQEKYLGYLSMQIRRGCNTMYQFHALQLDIRGSNVRRIRHTFYFVNLYRYLPCLQHHLALR